MLRMIAGREGEVVGIAAIVEGFDHARTGGVERECVLLLDEAIGGVRGMGGVTVALGFGDGLDQRGAASGISGVESSLFERGEGIVPLALEGGGGVGGVEEEVDEVGAAGFARAGRVVGGD